MATTIDQSPQASRDPFSDYQHFIQELLDDHTEAEIVAALAGQGFQTSTRSLQRRLRSWGFQQLAGASGVRNTISNGPARIFGRRWLITWLRLHG